MIECSAAVARAFHEPVSIERIKVKAPGPHEVRIKLLFASVCHTDCAILDGTGMKDFAHFPMILGHEGAGIVESIGEEVKNIQQGDHVLIHLIPQCGHCEYCVSEKTNQCITFSKSFRSGLNDDGSSVFTDSDGNKIHKFVNASLFSQYTVVNEASVCKVDESLPMDKLPLIGCCVITGYGASIKTCQIKTGDSVVIWGMGAVGLSAVMGAKSSGATRILAIDISDSKLALAKRLGATDLLNVNNIPDGRNLQEAVHSIAPRGFDYAIECIGKKETIRSAIDSCHQAWGKACIIGVCADSVSIQPDELIFGKTLMSSVCGGFQSNEVNWVVEQYKSGFINVDELITHRMKLSQINEAMDLIRKGECIRTVIDLHAE